MKTKTVSELSLLDRRFDIFDGSRPPDRIILEEDLYPPVVLLRRDGWKEGGTEHIPIWGWRIIDAAEAAGLPALRVKLLDDGITAALELVLRLEGRIGGFSLKEAAAVLDLLTAGNDDTDGSIPEEHFAQLLGGRTDYLRRVRDYQGLPLYLRTWVNTNLIDLKTASSLQDLPAELFCVAAEGLRSLSFSSRRLFLTLFSELFLRDSPAVPEAQNRLSALLRKKDPLAALRRLRYPQLTEMERRLQDYVRSNIAGTGITLQLPENFEGDRISFSFDLHHGGQLQRRLSDLKRIGESIDELFDLLS